jgi:hypothetical protein
MTIEDELIWRKFLERSSLWSDNLLSRDHFNDDAVMTQRSNLSHLKNPVAKTVALKLIQSNQ